MRSAAGRRDADASRSTASRSAWRSAESDPSAGAGLRVSDRRRKRPRRSSTGSSSKNGLASSRGPSGASSRTASRSEAKNASSSSSSPPSTALASIGDVGVDRERLVLGGEVIPRRGRVARWRSAGRPSRRRRRATTTPTRRRSVRRYSSRGGGRSAASRARRPATSVVPTTSSDDGVGGRRPLGLARRRCVRRTTGCASRGLGLRLGRARPRTSARRCRLGLTVRRSRASRETGSSTSCTSGRVDGGSIVGCRGSRGRPRSRRGPARGSPTRTRRARRRRPASCSRRATRSSDLGFEAAALALGDAARGGLGLADQRLRLAPPTPRSAARACACASLTASSAARCASSSVRCSISASSRLDGKAAGAAARTARLLELLRPGA